MCQPPEDSRTVPLCSVPLLPGHQPEEVLSNPNISAQLQAVSFRTVYIVSYNLLQFCVHSWILTNIIIRILRFGRDALADMFYSIGFATSLCQLFSILELYHIADGIEKARLLPRFIQVVERSSVLVMVIVLEEFQIKPVVSLLFFLWNIVELLRYPHELLSVMGTPSMAMLWVRYTLRIPLYILSVIIEGVTVYQALPHARAVVSADVQLSSLLLLFLALFPFGASITVWQLLKERQQQLDKWNKKIKRK
ncbi:hypothetical protein D4764_03G0007100 [Takifugu flavidus]|uniref:Very-long-chain (3R)-3-hydroxyacyl-CoA dehydratase n=1 Tax=Takifugu flavidus TaxID=433684 RepID=A0A5C6N8A7_9TELE|nr:hypothetical protein D4764_03G0007100 [Takifugu flavidus]